MHSRALKLADAKDDSSGADERKFRKQQCLEAQASEQERTSYKWAGSDSNRGLTDYESAALGR